MVKIGLPRAVFGQFAGCDRHGQMPGSGARP